MTSSNLRDLFDDATLDIPVSVAEPPLLAIRRRVVRRRAITGAGAAAAVAAVVAIASAVLYPYQIKNPPTPAASPSPTIAEIAWQIGYLDGTQLTVYATRLGKCTALEDPVATATRLGESFTISLTARPRTIPGCTSANPDRSRIPSSEQAKVRLDGPVALHLIRDASDGQSRPVYDLAELPARLRGDGHVFSVGVVPPFNGADYEFDGRYQVYGSTSAGYGIIGIYFHGLGLSETPPEIPDAEPATFGPNQGWLAPKLGRGSYRFVWHEGRGDGWITYEMYPDGGVNTKAELVDILERLVWQ